MRLFRAVYWRVRIVVIALRWVNKFNLGDRVKHDGVEWTLIQGVSAPVWDLWREESGRRSVHEREMAKVRSLSNYVGSFISGYRFYMQNWYAIWTRGGIKPWMRQLPIWGRRR